MPAVDGPPCPVCGSREWNSEKCSRGIIMNCLGCRYRYLIPI